MAARGRDDRPVLPDLIDTYLRILLIVAIMSAVGLLVAIWDHGVKVVMDGDFLVEFLKQTAFSAGIGLPIALLLVAEERSADRAERRSKARRRDGGD